MAKRGYKLQEFVAHSTNVNCLSIGKKACRLFVTGGDDHKVNLWAIGKPTSLMSLCGHTSPVESVVFDTSEVLVLAGASNGAVKLWDLDEAKMVRTLTGHRSNCSAVEFHPFGEFFASGSTDTNLRVWDIRKKGCIHTYRGHTQGISTIRFSPDGRWVVSGGFDNAVKIWDLTAGKLLHDFKFHEGHITSLDFHPLEFLLATGSADRTVKFWDLETFELIGSSRPEATGVSSIAFHPDGRTLFSGHDDSLKVYSWEPVICHDSVDMGWSTLGDICIHEGKLLGCSYYRNCVGVWVADISLIQPYGSDPVPEESECIDNKFDIARIHSSDKVGSGVRATSGLCPRSPEYEIKGIKNIYVDSTGGNPVTSQRVGSLSPKVGLPLDSKKMINPQTDKQCPAAGVDAKSNEQVHKKSSIAPTVVSRDGLAEKDSSNSGKERVTFSRTKPGMLLRPAHVRKQSNGKSEIEKMSMSLDSGTFKNMKNENRIVPGDEAKKSAHRRRPSSVKYDLEKLSLSHESGMSNKVSGTDEYVIDQNLKSQILSEDGAQESCPEKCSVIKSIAETFDTVISPKPSSNEGKCDETVHASKGVTSVKFVNGVAVVAGRTRTLVERFERQKSFTSEDQTSNMTTPTGTETESTSSVNNNMTEHEITEMARTVKVASSLSNCATPEIDGTSGKASIKIPCSLTETDRIPVTGSSTNFHPTQEMNRTPIIASNTALCHMAETNVPPVVTSSRNLRMIPGTDRRSSVASNMNLRVTPEAGRSSSDASNMNLHATPETDRSSSVASNMNLRVTPEAGRSSSVASNMNLHGTPETDRSSSVASNMNLHAIPETDRSSNVESNMNLRVTPEAGRSSSVASNMNLHATPETDRSSSVASNRNLRVTPEADRRSSVATNMNLHAMPESDRKSSAPNNMNLHATPETERNSSCASNMTLHVTPAADRRASVGSYMNHHSTSVTDRRSYVASNRSLRAIPERDRRRSIATSMSSRVIHEVSRAPPLAPRMPPRVVREVDKSPPACEMDISPPAQNEEPHISGRDSASSTNKDIIEDLIQSHDEFLSTLKSRLTKLQVVRHFWERNDIKGAINALRKLPDQSVQADVISVLTERIEVLTLDLFSCILPVLVGLLDSRMERHANVSLEMLVKLVAVFGSVISSTVSAPPLIGVDLHAEERRECCNQCFTHLQKIQQILPALTRKGGPLAKSAMELHLVLQVN